MADDRHERDNRSKVRRWGSAFGLTFSEIFAILALVLIATLKLPVLPALAVAGVIAVVGAGIFILPRHGIESWIRRGGWKRRTAAVAVTAAQNVATLGSVNAASVRYQANNSPCGPHTFPYPDGRSAYWPQQDGCALVSNWSTISTLLPETVVQAVEAWVREHAADRHAMQTHLKIFLGIMILQQLVHLGHSIYHRFAGLPGDVEATSLLYSPVNADDYGTSERGEYMISRRADDDQPVTTALTPMADRGQLIAAGAGHGGDVSSDHSLVRTTETFDHEPGESGGQRTSAPLSITDTFSIIHYAETEMASSDSSSEHSCNGL